MKINKSAFMVLYKKRIKTQADLIGINLHVSSMNGWISYSSNDLPKMSRKFQEFLSRISYLVNTDFQNIKDLQTTLKSIDKISVIFNEK